MLMVKNSVLHRSVVSYAKVSEHSQNLPNQRHFSDGIYCSFTGRIEQVIFSFYFSWNILW